MCSSDLCLPCGLNGSDLAMLGDLVYTRRRVKRGDSLFHAGTGFDSLFAVRSGFFKSSVVLEDGRDQVTGFHMAGEVLGMDGIGSGHHTSDVVALEDSEVCIMPFSLIEEAAREVPALQRHLHAVLSREIVRDHGVMMLLGSMRAEQRLAAFLSNLSKRFVRRGYSASDFHLRMTREDIGSYLGLKLETVSRLFSQFQKDGLIEVEQKHVRILSITGVEAILASAR